MKVSEVNLEVVCQYLNIYLNAQDNSPEANLLRQELNSYITASRIYLKEYSQLTEEEIEEKEYLTIPMLTLIADMYENKSMAGDSNFNQTFKSLMWLGKHITINMSRYGIKVNPGEYKHLITIQEFKEVFNNDDIPVREWVDVYKTRAKVLNPRGDEYLEEQNIGINIDKTFYIRYARNIPLSTDNQIICNGQIYNIVSVNNVLDLNKHLEIKVKLKR